MNFGLGMKVHKTRMMNDTGSHRAVSVVYAFNEEDKIKMNCAPTMRNAVNVRRQYSQTFN